MPDTRSSPPLLVLALLVFCAGAVRAAGPAPRVAFVGAAPGNALVAAAAELGVQALLSNAPSPADCDALAVCAPDYPRVEAPAPATRAAVDAFLASGKAVYLEYAPLPGVLGETAQTAGYERLFVSGDGLAADGLAPLTLLEEHASSYLPVLEKGGTTLLRYGKVAGVGRAVFGAPPQAEPALVLVPRGARRLLVAATALSHWSRGRYAPAREWRALCRAIVLSLLAPADAAAARARFVDLQAWTEPRVWSAPGEPVRLRVRAPGAEKVVVSVQAGAVGLRRTGEGEYVSPPLALPARKHLFRVTAVRAGARHITEVALDVSPRDAYRREALRRNLRWFERAGMLVAPDGSAGVREGLTSTIRPDGAHTVASGLRVDCVSECALAFLCYGEMAGDRRWRDAGRRMLEHTGRAFLATAKDSWYYGHWQSRGEFRDDEAPVYVFNDDSGAATLFALLGYAADGNRGLLEAGLRGVEYFCHTASEKTGLFGGMPHRNYEGSGPVGTPWPALRRQEIRRAAPHVMNLPLASLLVAYRLTGERRYLEIAKRGIGTLMAAPSDWHIVTSRTCEHTRMLLPLSLLQMVDPTPEHRKWLDTVAAYLMARQAPCGALQEWDGYAPRSNAEFGTSENSILQENGDPISDQLYNTGFAVLHLWLAWQATGDVRIRSAFERLADYACRIQIRGEDPLTDGTWLRAFDYGRWDYFGSSADVGWGPYCSETGWMCAPLDLGLALALTGRRLLPARPDAGLQPLAASIRREFDAVEAALSAPPPATLPGLRAAPARGPYAELSWDAPAGRPLFYTVYRSSQPDFVPGKETLVGKTRAGRWLDRSLDTEAAYYYRVVTANGLGQSSAPGPALKVVTGPPSKARGKRYAKVPAPYAGYPDAGDRESTDGVYAGAYGDGKSYAYRLAEVGSTARVEVTVGLEQATPVARAMHHNAGAPGYRPDSMEVLVSGDGETWASVGKTAEAVGEFLALDFPETPARFVRFRFAKERRGTADDWLFLDEIEVF